MTLNHSLAALAAVCLTLSACAKPAASPESASADATPAVEAPMTALTPKQQVRSLLRSIETGDPAPVGFINASSYTQHNLSVGDGLAGFGEALAALPEGSGRADVIRVFQDGDMVFAHTDYNFFGPKIGFDIFRFEDGKIVEHWDNLQPTAGPNPSGRSMTDGPTAVSQPGETQASKALVRGFVHDILIGGAYDRMGQFIGETYLQHNPAIGDSLDGLGAALAAMAEQGITMEYDTLHTVLGEGDFVLTVSEGAFGGAPTSFYDMFRVQDGRIVEHWDVMETIAPESEWKHSNGKFGF